jgi:hypothetical protein
MTVLASSSSIQFTTTAVNATSAVKQLVLLMQDNVGAVQISTSGDFGQTNDCNLASYARPYCTVMLTFSPTVAGAANGNLTVDYNLNPPSGFSPGTLTIPLSGNALSPSSLRPGRPPVLSGTVATHPFAILSKGRGEAAATSSSPNAKPALVPATKSKPAAMNKPTSRQKSKRLEQLDGVN